MTIPINGPWTLSDCMVSCYIEVGHITKEAIGRHALRSSARRMLCSINQAGDGLAAIF